MEQQIHITLCYHFATGKVNLNEIVYRLQELKNPLMLSILEKILLNYDDMIAERLSHHGGVIPPSKRRKGLGRHVRKQILKTDIAMVEGFENAAIAVTQEDFQQFSATWIYPFVWQNVVPAAHGTRHC